MSPCLGLRLLCFLGVIIFLINLDTRRSLPLPVQLVVDSLYMFPHLVFPAIEAATFALLRRLS
jgi:hypothetical protein